MHVKDVVRKIISLTNYDVMHRNALSDLQTNLKTLRSEIKAVNPGSRESGVFSHAMTEGYPNVSLGSNAPSLSDADVDIAERILIAYQRTEEDDPGADKAGEKKETDVWDAIKEENHRELIEKLEQNDPRALAEYLVNYGKKYISFGGLSQGLDGYSLDKNPDSVAASYFDKLVCFAEALGIVPVENPEHGRWGENIYAERDSLVELIQKEIGINIIPPQSVTPMIGIQTARGLIHYRSINSLYCAWKINEILRGISKPSVCEIGGGFGGVAVYCNRFGMRDYTLIDLPLTNVVSAFYLLKSLPGADVILYGEKGEGATAVKIYPYWCIEEIPDKSISLTLNQDSFPEIERSIVLTYFDQIKRISREYFFSVNQEGEGPVKSSDAKELNVSALMRDQEGFVRLQRNLCWVRVGYTDELYGVNPHFTPG